MLRERLGLLARSYSLSRKRGWIRLAGTLGIVCQMVVMGTLLFFALLSLHAATTSTRVFKYMEY